MTRPTTIPASASAQWASFFGVGVFCVLYLTLWPTEAPAIVQSLLAMLCFGLPVIVVDFVVYKVHRRTSTGLDWHNPRPIHWRRVAEKWLGFAFIIATMAAGYWLFPVYGGTMYQPFLLMFHTVLPSLLILAIPYFAYMDKYLAKPHDAYCELGRWLMGKNPTPNKAVLVQLYLGWLVKAFFLPLMLGYLNNSIQNLNGGIDLTSSNLNQTFDYLHNFAYLIDLLVVSVGYCYTLRLADTHIRTSEPTMLGWVVAVICYHPFWGVLFYNEYFAYQSIDWIEYFSDAPTLQIIWCSVILLLTAIYAWASVCFGLRFSNLTYRGIITSGCYRWTKHPAYLSKNLSWWMVSLPFLFGDNTLETLRNCLLLGGINCIYYVRARTEERHLAHYVEYREYMAWMQEHGIITKWLYRMERVALGTLHKTQRLVFGQ